MNVSYDDHARIGDHIWYVSDTRKFRSHYPDRKQEYDAPKTIGSISCQI